MTNDNAPDITIRTTQGGERFEAAPPASVTQSKGIMATARAPHGGAITGREPGPADLVEILGGTMPLETAARHGFVKRTSDGRFVDLEEGDPEPTIDKPEEAQEPDLTHALEVDADTEDALKDLAGALDSEGINPAGLIHELLANPEAMPEDIRVLAESRGMDVGIAQEHVRGMAAAVEEAILDYCMTRGNISSEQLPAFTDYLKNTIGIQKLSSAASQAIFLGDARPFLGFCEQFQVSHGFGRGSVPEENIRTAKPGGAAGPEVRTVSIKGLGRVGLESARRLKLV